MSSRSAARPTACPWLRVHCTTRVVNRMLLVAAFVFRDTSRSINLHHVCSQPPGCMLPCRCNSEEPSHAEPATVEDLEQSIRDAQDKFNEGMGADGDASPYPLLKELRAQSAGARRLAGDGHGRQLRRRPADVHRLLPSTPSRRSSPTTSPSARAATRTSSGRCRVRRSWRCRNPNTRSTASCTSSPSPGRR